MARRQQPQPSGFVLFDVLYEDGTQSSNRKVPATELGGLDGDAPARTFVEIQATAERRPFSEDQLGQLLALARKGLAPSAMGSPLGLGDKLAFATISGEVVLTAPDGRKLWSAKLGGSCHAPPVAADGMLVVGCDDGNVYAFREKSGK